MFIHPFDHPDIIAGQGTVGLEILEQCPEVRTIVVGIGGGGLAAGIAVAVKALRPGRAGRRGAGGGRGRVSALAGGRAAGGDRDTRRRWPTGSRSGRPGDVPFGIIGELVDEVRTVSEDELSSALLLCLERAKLVVEPAGASPVAALLSDPEAFEGPVVAVLSGGNVDPLLMQRILRARHGRGGPLPVAAAAADGPAGRARDASGGVVGGGRQVLDVSHVRTDPRLGLTEAEVELHLETKGPEHCAEVGTALREAGYTVVDCGSAASAFRAGCHSSGNTSEQTRYIALWCSVRHRCRGAVRAQQA